MDLELQQIVDAFLKETAEGLHAAESALIALEARADDEEAVGTVFRVVHTVKGNAGSLGFAAMASFAHVLEDVLDRVRKGSLATTPERITVLLGAVDALGRMLRAGPAACGEMEARDRELLERIAAMAGASTPPEPGAAAPGPPRDTGRRWDDVGLDRTLRVERDKLDRMLDLTGEIAIVHGRLKQALGERGGTLADAREAHLQADLLFSELQELVMRARMVPLGPVFRRYVRTVRDLALAQGKQVRLVLEGEDVEVDTTVVEHIRDPLTHLIRNAIDHGIEPPSVRTQRGKDACGRLTLSAAHEGGTIVLQVSDDGAGLDREKILARGRALGLAAEGVSADDQVRRLILLPGFSTADVVTELSGRGVGLDVVRRNIEALRGSVEVSTRPGEGTAITLRLPLTLAVIAGLSVRAGGETYVIPLDCVVECIDLPEAEAAQADGRGVVSLRGRALPFLQLRRVMGLGEGDPSRQQVVVVRAAEGTAGLAVDVVHGESQAVIKPLGRQMRGGAPLAGATILGDGRVALIVDVPALLRRTTNEQADLDPRAVGAGRGPCVQEEEKGERPC
jgi:two-component system chemotaxis sensor kinase CheA